MGEGNDGLRAAHRVDGVNAAEGGGAEDFVGDRRRGAERDVAATGEAGGHGEHQHGGKQRRAAAGDVEANALNRAGDDLTAHAGAGFEVDERRLLRAVEGFDVVFGEAHCRLQGGGDARRGGIAGGGGDGERVQVHAVKLRGEAAQGGVAIGKHGGINGGDGIADGRALLLCRAGEDAAAFGGVEGVPVTGLHGVLLRQASFQSAGREWRWHPPP